MFETNLQLFKKFCTSDCSTRCLQNFYPVGVVAVSVMCSVCPNEGWCVMATRPKKASGRYDEAGRGRVSVIAFCMKFLRVWMCECMDIMCVCMCVSIHFSSALFQLNCYITLYCYGAQRHFLSLWPLFSSLCPLCHTYKPHPHTDGAWQVDAASVHVRVFTNV